MQRPFSVFTVIVIGSGSFGSGNCMTSNDSDDVELSTCFLLLLQHKQMMIPIMMNTSLNPEYAIINSHGMWKSNIIYHPVLFVISHSLTALKYSSKFPL